MDLEPEDTNAEDAKAEDAKAKDAKANIFRQYRLVTAYIQQNPINSGIKEQYYELIGDMATLTENNKKCEADLSSVTKLASRGEKIKETKTQNSSYKEEAIIPTTKSIATSHQLNRKTRHFIFGVIPHFGIIILYINIIINYCTINRTYSRSIIGYTHIRVDRSY
jgi:hypothetical protein